MLHSTARLSRSTFSSSALTWTRTSRLVLSMFSDGYFDRRVYGTFEDLSERLLLNNSTYVYGYTWNGELACHPWSELYFDMARLWVTRHLVEVYRDNLFLLVLASTLSGRALEDNSPHVLTVTVWWSAQAEFMTLDTRTIISSPRQTIGDGGALFQRSIVELDDTERTSERSAAVWLLLCSPALG